MNNTKFCCCHGDYCNLNITSSNLDYSDNKIFNPLSSQKCQPSKINSNIKSYYIYYQYHIVNYITISPATEYLEQSNSEQRLLFIVSVISCLLLTISIIIIVLYKTYRNKILASLGKPLSYNDQFMDSTALRTGTYTVDHLKLATIVGMFSLTVFNEVNLVVTIQHLIVKYIQLIDKYIDKYIQLCEL